MVVADRTTSHKANVPNGVIPARGSGTVELDWCGKAVAVGYETVGEW